MQFVWFSGTSQRGYRICRRYIVMYIVDNGIVQIAASSIHLCKQFSNEKWYILCFQSKFFQHTTIYKINTGRPCLLTIIRTTLMQQNAFYNTHLLRLFSQFHHSTEWLVVLVSAETLEPVSTISNYTVCLVLIKEINTSSSYSNIYYSHNNRIWQILYHSTSKIICRSKACPRTT